MSRTDTDLSYIAEALPAFISEAHEQIEMLEQLLLQLEDAPGDRDLLDALFRCAHTIKGSAGIFGLVDVVGFTHEVETLLDQVRGGAIDLTPATSTLLLRSNDQIRLLIDAAQRPATAGPDGDAAHRQRAELVRELQAAGAAAAAASPQPKMAEVAEAALPAGDGVRRWHISVAFGAETFRNGMDPLAIFGYLGGLGRLATVVCDLPAIAALDSIDPEACSLSFELALDTAARREEIEAAFSFVRDDCALHLIEPGASAAAFAALIAQMPDQPRLGDILVQVGAISRSQLNQALQQQSAAALTGDGQPLGEILQAQSGLSGEVVAAALHKQQQQRQSRPQAATPTTSGVAADDNRFIRVHADRLDAVINLLGELVIAGAGAALMARQTRQRGLIEANLQMARLIEEIRNGTLQLRMVPIGETFSRFRRVVRDTAAELGKAVQLEIVGGETEMDKSVVERIADPLMHLVRNALDHGLETPEQRVACGKPTQGRLTLAACHEAGNIVIRIRDDGRGIQRDKVLQRAWDRGLLEHGSVPSETELLNLIFEPGFSTAEKVTNLSGRGVGMDVVRRNILALRGSLALHSTEGQGSCIEVRLPLTLAIIDGFLVGVGRSRFIFPLEAVVEVIENRPTASALDGRGRGVVELRGQVLPVVCLRTMYALESTPPGRHSVVVLKAGGQHFGVLVDQLLGQHQTVIKPLGRLFGSLRGMSGSSILGNGDVALIFDVTSLSQLAADGAAAGASPSRGASVNPVPGLKGPSPQPIPEGQAS